MGAEERVGEGEGEGGMRTEIWLVKSYVCTKIPLSYNLGEFCYINAYFIRNKDGVRLF